MPLGQSLMSLCLPPFRASTLSNAVSSLANTGISFTRVDEREKQAALDEEQTRLKALKVCPDMYLKTNMYKDVHLVLMFCGSKYNQSSGILQVSLPT